MALTMVGTQAPQKLFGDVPAEAARIPGTVTPNITAAMPSNVDWDAVNAALGVQQKMRDDSANRWARAAAINNARAAQANAGGNQGHDLPGTASQTSGMGYRPPQGSVLWAPRNLQGAKLGTWASQQQNRAIAENREMPVVLQAHANDPYSPGEVGGGLPNSVIGRGIYGPGISTALGVGSNPAVWAKMWGGGGGGGRTRQGQPANPFSEESRQRMNLMAQQRAQESSGPQYRYDMFGGR